MYGGGFMGLLTAVCHLCDFCPLFIQNRHWLNCVYRYFSKFSKTTTFGSGKWDVDSPGKKKSVSELHFFGGGYSYSSSFSSGNMSKFTALDKNLLKMRVWK